MIEVMNESPREILEWWEEQARFIHEIDCRLQAINDIRHLVEIIEKNHD